MFNLYPYLNVNDLNLDWLLLHFKEFMEALADLESWRNSHEQEYEELKRFMDEINAGHLPDTVYDELRTWIIANSTDIIAELVKMVFFNLNDAGYFVAYIPDSWSDIIFGTTGLDTFPAGIDYGHLTLNY